MTDVLPQRISSGDAPDPLGAYAHAVRTDGMIFCSGQGARDPVTGHEAGIKTDAEGRVRGPGASYPNGRNLRPAVHTADAKNPTPSEQCSTVELNGRVSDHPVDVDAGPVDATEGRAGAEGEVGGPEHLLVDRDQTA